MVSDHISDFLTRIRNGYRANNQSVDVINTRVVKAVAKVLVEEGYLMGIKEEQKKLIIRLKYQNREPVVTGIVRISKPGGRVYRGILDLPRVRGGMGTYVLSTPKGILSYKQARKLNSGGEVLLKIW
jgi:small subunit ribosomal protein S8